MAFCGCLSITFYFFLQKPYNLAVGFKALKSKQANIDRMAVETAGVHEAAILQAAENKKLITECDELRWKVTFF